MTKAQPPVPEDRTAAAEPSGVIDQLRHRLAGLPDNTKGALWILVAALLFSIMVTVIKLAGEKFSVFQILLVRQAVMALIVAPTILKGLPNSLTTRRPGLQALRVIFATTAMLCGFTALIELPLADATALSFSKAFFLTVFAILFLGETVGAHRWGATIIGFLGVLLMLRPEGSGFVNPYALLAIASAGCAGMVMVILRILTRTDSPTTILTYQAVCVGLLMLVPGIYTWTPPTAWEWGVLIFIGAISWAAQMCNIMAFRSGEATSIASLDYTRLLYATFFGIWVFGQWPSWETLVGAGIIIAASLYTVRREAIRGRELARASEGRGYNN